MNTPLSKESMDQLFTEARTHHAWLNQPIEAGTLEKLYELAKWGPTAVNANPMRILFIQSDAAKEKLYPALMGSNVEQVKAAPVTAVIAWDENFFEHLPKLFPHFDARPMFNGNKEATFDTGFRNSTLQGAYLIMAARALGLDAGPMSGFNNAAVDEAFFKGTGWKSNFICTLGYGDHSKLFPRGERLPFDVAVKVV